MPSPLQKRTKDFQELGGYASFELLSFEEISHLSEKLLAKIEENTETETQNFSAILCNPWISPSIAMAMSTDRTLCVLVLQKSDVPS